MWKQTTYFVAASSIFVPPTTSSFYDALAPGGLLIHEGERVTKALGANPTEDWHPQGLLIRSAVRDSVTLRCYPVVPAQKVSVPKFYRSAKDDDAGMDPNSGHAREGLNTIA